MAYEPTIWEDGDVITADKINKLEQGLAEASAESGSAGKTYKVLISYTGNSVFSGRWTVTLGGSAVVNGERTFTDAIVPLTMTCISSYTEQSSYGASFSVYLNNDIVLGERVLSGQKLEAGKSNTVDVDVSIYDGSTLTIKTSAS